MSPKLRLGDIIKYIVPIQKKLLIWVTVTVIGRLYRETDTVLKKLLILIKY